MQQTNQIQNHHEPLPPLPMGDLQTRFEVGLYLQPGAGNRRDLLIWK
jgi:hypothetical protein